MFRAVGKKELAARRQAASPVFQLSEQEMKQLEDEYVIRSPRLSPRQSPMIDPHAAFAPSPGRQSPPGQSPPGQSPLIDPIPYLNIGGPGGNGGGGVGGVGRGKAHPKANQGCGLGRARQCVSWDRIEASRIREKKRWPTIARKWYKEMPKEARPERVKRDPIRCQNKLRPYYRPGYTRGHGQIVKRKYAGRCLARKPRMGWINYLPAARLRKMGRRGFKNKAP